MTEAPFRGRSNGYNGAASLHKETSLLAKVVFYVVTASAAGRKPTRAGFAKSQFKKTTGYAKDIFAFAAQNGFIKFTGERVKGNKVYEPGENASQVATNLQRLGA